MAGKIQNIKGTVDILPEEIFRWHFLEDAVRKVMKNYNYCEMRTPVFEKTDLFARGIGELTDIVSKEMYTFLDMGKKSLTLKPEMTAPIMRAYLQHSMFNRSQMNKIYYVSPMFRQENPQAGRQRQFHQFGAEALGSGGPEIDAELIMLALDIYNSIGLKNYTLKINSVGEPVSRARYKEDLQAFFKPRLNQFCESCRTRYETNPLRIFDCKVESCRNLAEDAPFLIDYLDAESLSHYERVKDVLNSNNVNFVEDQRLVRGLDYYTHTVFEITALGLGAQDAICGGGRYNLLSRELGGSDFPAVGFASGMERVLIALEKNEISIPLPKPLDIYFVSLGDAALDWVHKTMPTLRRSGVSADTDYLGRSMKAQMREANKIQARYVVIIGENELAENKVAVKNMSDSTQHDVNISDFHKRIHKILHE